MQLRAYGWFRESCDVPVVCLRCPTTLPLPWASCSPCWGPHCQRPLSPGHGGHHGRRPLPKAQLRYYIPSKEEQNDSKVSELLQCKTQTLWAGKALWNLSSGLSSTFLGLPSVQPTPAPPQAGPWSPDHRRCFLSSLCSRAFSMPGPHRPHV